jgi:hypothetical protein
MHPQSSRYGSTGGRCGGVAVLRWYLCVGVVYGRVVVVWCQCGALLPQDPHFGTEVAFIALSNGGFENEILSRFLLAMVV